MKPICVLLVITHTFSCFRCEAEVDWLQTDSYTHRSNYRNIWSYRNNTNVNDGEACDQTPKDDGIIEFGPDTAIELCDNGSQIYKWHVNVSDNGGYDVNVTISSLHLNENAGNYLIISPGPSLVQDEASVVITGEIQKPKMFRVVDHDEMTVLLVIPEGITSDTWRDNYFKLSYNGLTTDTPDTTTPKHTSSTPEPSAARDATVYVEVLDGEFNKTGFREAVANMARAYCDKKNITTLYLIGPENVNLTAFTGCPLTWPNRDRCIRIVMIVPVSVPANKPYELTRSSLEEMWKMYADKLEGTGLKVFEVPDNNIILTTWLPISLGVAAIFTLLMAALWCFDIFNISNKKVVPLSPDPRISNVSKQSWVSNNSYQEVPPMTDLRYDDIYNEPKENRQITASPNTLPVSHARPPASDQFSGAYYFQPQGYDNPSFDHSSEKHHPSKADYHDDTSSDDDASATKSTDTKSHQDHLHTATKQVTNEDNKHESAL